MKTEVLAGIKCPGCGKEFGIYVKTKEVVDYKNITGPIIHPERWVCIECVVKLALRDISRK